MSRLLFLTVAILSFFSCSTIEDNSPALQAQKGNDLFKTATNSAVFNPDGSLVIRGETGNNETINFLIGSTNSTEITFGEEGSGNNTALFIDRDGNEFSTDVEGSFGTLTYDLEGTESVTGDFKFTALTAGMTDTVVFSRGVIFKVPFVSTVIIDLPDPVVEDGFFAKVNTIDFVPTIITNNITNGMLNISGQRSGPVTILISMPPDITAGDYALEAGTPISGSYTNGAGTAEATSGRLEIISNDTSENIIIGEFDFSTEEGFIITDGTFTINY